jgi:hypothetical protein
MSITTSLILRLSRAQSVWNAAVLAFALVWTRLPPSYNELARRLWKRAGSRRSSGTPPHLGRPGRQRSGYPFRRHRVVHVSSEMHQLRRLGYQFDHRHGVRLCRPPRNRARERCSAVQHTSRCRFCTGLYDSPDGQGFLEAPKFHYKGNIPSSLLRIIFGMLEAESSPMRTSFTLGTSVSVAIVSQYYLTTRSADTSYIDTSISRAKIENIALQLNSEYVFSS